ncbi:hypothetical protein [Winogradskyella sp. R77965]|uniref:hypothetical protein n=1 Tax=Winogradskyella sp. R77965 TaxID=3093872 RepID=UPI0037DC0070
MRILLLTLFLVVFSCKNDTQHFFPIESYQNEISNLKTDEQISSYWKKLYDLDQVTYLKETKTQKEGDSISVANMIRVALIIETHGKESYKPNINAPWVVHAHNYISKTSLAYWPIINQLISTNKGKNSINQNYPSYYLEGISLTFYDYSLFNQNNIHEILVNKLNGIKYSKVSTSLQNAYSQHRSFMKLNTKEVIGTWQRQNFKNNIDKSLGNFQILTMSDNRTYIKRDNRLQLLKTEDETLKLVKYKIDQEPFNWHYELTNTGELSLKNDKGEILIEYKKY